MARKSSRHSSLARRRFLALRAVTARHRFGMASRAATLAAAGVLVFAGVNQAATITKTATAGALSAGASYVGGVAPGAGDIALFNNTITAAQTDSLGANFTLGELQIVNPGGAITITDASFVLTLNGVNGIGIDLSAATQNLTINAGVVLGAAQTWVVASGRTLTLGGTSLNAGANLLTIAGAGTTTINASSVISSTAGITKIGSGSLNIIGAASNTNSIGTSTLTINGGVVNLSAPTGGGANVLNSTANVALGGGTLLYTFAVNGVNQTLANLTVNAGESVIFANRNGSFNSSLLFSGTVTRTIGGTLTARPVDTSRQQVDFSSIGATPLLTSNGTAYLTLGNSTSSTVLDNFQDWGAINASHQTIAATYTSTTATTLGTSAQNANVVAGVTLTTLAGPTVVASFRDGVNAATTIDLAGNTLQTGGILVNSTVATAGSNIRDTVGTGSLTGPAGSDLTLMISANAVAPVPFTISANIVDNLSVGGVGTALTKGAPGTVILSGNNTFTNGLYINDGTVQLGNVGALNATTPNAVFFDGSGAIAGVANTVGGANGGTLATAPTLALAGNSVTVASISSTNDLGGSIPVIEDANGSAVGNAVLTVNNAGANTFAGTAQNGTGGGTLGLTKGGAGTLTLTGADTYTGATTVNAGSLVFAATALPASTAFNVAGGATLDISATPGLTLVAGKTLSGTAASGTTATVLGGVTLSGGVINAGVAGSVLQSTTLTLSTGTLNYSITDPTTTSGTSSLLNVTAVNGLTLNGGTVTLNGGTFTNGSTYNITYNLIQFNGAVLGSGAPALTLAAGSQVNGLTYTFGIAGGEVTLNIAGTPLFSANWITDGSGSWASAANWDTGVPNAQFATANLGGAAPTHANLARTVTLDGDKTVGALNFSSPNGESYTVSQGTGGSLILDNGTNSAVLSASGTHAIDATAPVNLSSNLTVSTGASGDKLTISGVVANTNTGTLAAVLTKTGSGTLVLGNANTYGPGAGAIGTNLNGGVIQILNGAALGSGDLSFGATATLQSIAPGLTLANNVTIGNGVVGTIGTGGNILTLTGTVSGAGALTLASATSGGVGIFTNANTYTGGTTINAGATLQVGNNTATGSLPATGTIADAGILSFKRSDASTVAVGNTISGAGSVTQSGAAGNILLLSGTNTYTGGTTISGGAVQLGSNGGLGSGDVSIATNLDLASFSPTVGALSGAGMIDSSVAGTMTVSIGNNNNGGTFSGAIKNTTGTVSLVKNGTGVETLSGAETYTGATTVNGGTLTFTNSLGANGTPAGAVSVLSSATLNFNGATVFATGLAQNGFASATVTGGSALTLSGTLAVNSNNASSAGFVAVPNGSITANAVTVGRGGTSLAASGLQSGPTTDGLYINGGTVNIATTLALGTASTNSSASVRLDSGSITVGGTTSIADNNSGRASLIDIEGGTFTSNDTTGAGILIGGGFAGSAAEVIVRNGTLNVNKLTLGATVQTSGTDEFLAVGGTTFIGSGGIVSAGSGPSFITAFGNATVATAPVIAAKASWASALPITLTNSSASVAPTFQAADAGGLANDITLTGVLSGAGGLIKTGGGALNLTAANTYTGTTTVNAGTLNVTGSTAAASAVTVAGGTLSGTGNVAGAVVVNSGGTLLAGTGGATPVVGNLSTGAVTLNAGSTFSSVISGDAQSSVSTLIATGGTSAAGNFSITLLGTPTFAGGSGDVLTLIPSGFTGTFSNASYTTGGYTFTADYLALPGGFDVDVSAAAAVPEPATWLAGFLMVGALGYKGRKQIGSLLAV